MKKKALICGISGQDGAYLAAFLLDKGYEVVGTSRDAAINPFRNLELLKIKNRVTLISMSPNDFGGVFTVIRDEAPHEIYNLSGQSSVSLSFDQPKEAVDSITIDTLNFLQVIRVLGRPIKFFNAGSGECYGDTGGEPATEQTRFCPMSPYAIAKVASHHLVECYRESFGIFCCTGILFNHESPLRLDRFVTQKIVKTAVDISKGNTEKLIIGNLDVYRDWGWAPEYVQVMWLMLQMEKAEDFVIATGESIALSEFVRKTFNYFDLDYERYLEVDEKLFRPSDPKLSRANPNKIKDVLGWQAKIKMDEIITLMCNKAH